MRSVHASHPAAGTRTESEIQNAIFERYGREPDVTLYRNNTGVARSEIVTKAHLERLLGWARMGTPAQVRSVASLIQSLLDERPRFTRYGLCEGSSDIIGIVQVPVPTSGFESIPDHGIFLALEVKKPGKHPTKEQQLFLDLINRRGGVGRCVHSEDEAGAAIEEARRL